MKFKASILFFWGLVYVLELAALPVYCMAVEKKESACVPKAETACSRKAESACARKRADSPCKKPAKESCSNTADCCLNCPLCYVMTMPGVAMAEKPMDNVKKEYSLYQSNYLFIYCSTTWKPPNGC